MKRRASGAGRAAIGILIAVLASAGVGLPADEAGLSREERLESLRILADLATIPSQSGNAEGVAQAARWLAQRFTDVGLNARILPPVSGGNPIVYAEDPPSKDHGFTVMFYLHYDTQPTGSDADWESTGGDPFLPTLWSGLFEEEGARRLASESIEDSDWDGARLYARGVADDKAPIVMHLSALARRRDAAARGTVRVKYLLDGEEEAGSPHMTETLARHGALLDADLLVLCDGPMDAAARPSVYLGTRGDMHMRLSITTASASAHSGNYTLLPNAAWRIAALLATMKDAEGRVTVEGFLDDVVPPTPQERRAMEEASSAEAAIAAHLGVPAFEGDPRIPYFERLLFGPGLIINHLAAGRPGNQIPNTAEALLEVRLVTSQEPQKMFEAFRRHVERRMPDAVIEMLGGTPAARMHPGDPIVAAGVDAARTASGGTLLVYPTLGGTLPLLSDFQKAGYRYLGLPLVNFDNAQHVANENLRVSRLDAGTLFLERFLAALEARAKAPGTGSRP